MRIPYATEVQIVRRRLETDVESVMQEFGIARGTLHNIMNRNEDLVREIKAQMRHDAVMGEAVTSQNKR